MTPPHILGTTMSGRKRALGWRQFSVQAVLLMGFWIILSGRMDAFHLILGAISVVMVIALNYRFKREKFAEGDHAEWEDLRIEYVIPFLSWLMWEIVLGSFHVAYVVLHPRMPVSPSLVKFRVGIPSLNARVLLGNVITLTPGTITLELEGEEFLVHSITREASTGILNGVMAKKVSQLFSGPVEPILSAVRMPEVESRR